MGDRVRMRRLAVLRLAALAITSALVCVACTGQPSAAPTRTKASEPSKSAPAGKARTKEARPAQSPRPDRAPRVPRGRLRTFVAVDGDTIASGPLVVRVVGIDTPELGECGYERAKSFTGRFVARGARLMDRQGRDRYDRVLAAVSNARGRDLGTALLRRGLANARYDSTDGYAWHPRQDRYQGIDKRIAHVCGRRMDSLAGPEPWRGGGRPFPDCATAEAAGAAPLRRSDPRFNPDLDGDGDGVACE